ncbi:MAG: hypothetical protein HY870_22910 [Chloroflexi bacterium]|nr:hypothetical protein [Chloroflexota bacterium]
MSSNLHSAPAGPPDALATLRALLNQPDNWPEQADRLLAHLDQSSRSGDWPDYEDETLLSLAVDDALKGIDISRRYPAFFQRMLVDHDLRQAFLDTLGALDSQAVPASVSPQLSLDFLSTSSRRLIREFVSPARWRLVWQAALDQIQQIFFSADQFQPAYRSDDYLEDAWFTLFRNEIDIDQAHVSVVLEAVRLIATPDQLQLHIAVGVTPDQAATTDRLPDLRAQLIWGTYDQAVTITQRGRATFPPLPLNLVLDETHQRVASDLRLIVEPAL